MEYTDQQIHELIDSYLNGELIGTELDAFRKRMRQDADFATRVTTQEKIIEVLREEREKELKLFLSKAVQKRSSFFLNRVLTLAASLLLLMSIGLGYIYLERNGNLALFQNKEDSTDSLSAASEDERAVTEKEELKKKASGSEEGVGNGQQDKEETVAADEMPTEDDVQSPTESTVLETDENTPSIMDELRERERLADQGEPPVRDSIVGEKFFQVRIVDSYKTRTSSTAQTTEKNTNTNTSEVKDAPESSQKEAAVEEDIKSTAVQNLKVEFWISIVGFDGYKYDGTTLLLFNTPTGTPLSFVSYKNVLYMKRNGSVYQLNAGGSFNKYSSSKISSAEIIKLFDR